VSAPTLILISTIVGDIARHSIMGLSSFPLTHALACERFEPSKVHHHPALDAPDQR